MPKPRRTKESLVSVRVYLVHGVHDLQVRASSKAEALDQALRLVRSGKIQEGFFDRHGRPLATNVDLLPAVPLSPWVAVAAGDELMKQRGGQEK